jgi:hypothetical protein
MSWSFFKINRTHLTLDSSLMYLLPNANYRALLQQYFSEAVDRGLVSVASADTIKETLVNSLIALRDAARWATEYVLFEDLLQRRRVQSLQPMQTKTSYALYLLFAYLAFLLAVAWGVAAAAVVQGYRPGVLPAVFLDALHHLPALPSAAWLGLLAVLTYLYLLARALRRNFKRPDSIAR